MQVMQAIVFGISVTVVSLCLIVAVRTLYRGWVILKVKTTTSGWNTDNVAAEHFMTLLHDAQERMVVYDDGNNMKGSIYKNDEIINAVRSKLEKQPGFELFCYFNCDDDLPFTEAFRQHDRAQIVTGTGERPDDVHYKIIDSGRKAHLSRHELGSTERRYRVVDCTDVPKRSLEYATDVLLEPSKSHAKSKGNVVILEMEFPPIHLYAVLALAGTLASVVTGHLREPDRQGKGDSLIAMTTCGILLAAWLQLIVVLSYKAWQMNGVALAHILFHLLVIATMLPVVCGTLLQSWIRQVKQTVEP